MLGWIRLARAPGSAIAIVVMLALGIGAATAAFSLAAAVWLNPLPYPHSRQLVNLWLRNRNYPDLYDGLDGTAQELRRELPGLAQVAPYETGEAVCRVHGRRVQLGVALVAPGFFPLLGLAPAQGRFFRDAADDAAVAAPESGLGVGENITCAGQTYRVIGIAPAALRFPRFLVPGRASVTALWLPLTSASTRILASSVLAQPAVLARLRPGTTNAELGAQLAALSEHLPQSERPNPRWNLTAVSVVAETVGGMRAPLLMLFLASLLVWLIAVANSAHLLLERSWARRGEMSLRLALGASPASIMRQVLADGELLSLLGGGAGLALAFAALAAARAWAPAGWLPINVRVNLPVALFALAAAVAAGLAASWLPARQAVRADPQSLLRGRSPGAIGGGRTGARAVVLAIELALAIVLLACAGLLEASFARLASEPFGFRGGHVVELMLLPPPKSFPDAASRRSLEQRLLHNVGTMPGVQAAVLSGTPVLAGVTFFEPPLRSSAATLPRYQHHAVGPGYFRLLDIPLLRGRDFRPEDWQQKPMVAVVNRAFAQRAWPNSDPIGKTLRPASGKGVFSLRVVGVVGDTRDNRVADAPMPEIYTEFSGAVQSVVVFVRSRGDPDASWSAWSQSLRREVWSTAGDVPITLLHPLRDVVAAAHAGPRFRATVLASLALLGLVLAVLGVYSVFAYAASRRRQEVAIRMALGARPAAITALYLSSGLRVALAGVAVGVPGAWLAERVLRAELPGLIPGGTGALVAAAALLFAAAMAACYLPARRAHDARLTDWLRQP